MPEKIRIIITDIKIRATETMTITKERFSSNQLRSQQTFKKLISIKSELSTQIHF